MPELPEVECVCRLMRATLKGHRIEGVEAMEDAIVFKKLDASEVEARLEGQRVEEIGRKGKNFWLRMSGDFALLGHLGMSGWVEHLEPGQEHPRFTKLVLTTEKGDAIAITDGRRLGRIWFADDPLKDPQVAALGFDAYRELPKGSQFHELIVRRKAPIKAVLLDQGVFAGVGNYLADEVLYHAHIAPQREAKSLTEKETGKLRTAMAKVVTLAVEADADEEKFPKTWLFHHRWGGKRGAERIGKHKIVRETVAGRTTAWVPEVQK